MQYEALSNNNGKITHQAYVDSVLEPIISDWCKEDDSWALEEDNDSSYGNNENNNVVKRWKKAHGLSRDPSARHRYYFNCPQSPDLSIIEDT